jgi:hypothetical protein
VDISIDQRDTFNQGTLQNMCQRKIRNHSMRHLVSAIKSPGLSAHALHHIGDSRKAVHHTFWSSGGARCVGDQCNVVACPCNTLDVLSCGIAKTAANEPKFEPKLLVPEVPAEAARQLLTEKMLADRWVCSVARLQRWRTVGEGPQYLKIVGKVLYRLKDIEAYEEACLIRKVL